VAVAAVRSAITSRLAAGHATVAEVAADLGLGPLPTRLLLDCLRSTGYVAERSGRYRLSRSARRWLDPASPLSVAGYVAGTADYWSWWAGLDETVRAGTSSGSHGAPPGDAYWRRYMAGQRELARLAERYPTLTATVLDLPGSAAIGRELIAAADLADRVLFRDGDVTVADLGTGYDAVLCFNLVHHLAPDAAASLFRRIGGALKPGATLAVLIQADAHRLPLRAGAFDAVFMSFVLELIDTPQIPALPDECHRVLRPCGRLAVVSLQLTQPPAVMARLYLAARRHLPGVLDCRPIPVP
jgi:SAM-dependent methyltransferase